MPALVTRFGTATFSRRNETTSAIGSQLDAYVAKALLHPTLSTLHAGILGGSASMSIQGNRVAYLSAQKLVERHDRESHDAEAG